jgi:hypothetical protein
MSKRIAPTLQMITDSSWRKTKTGGQARTELRALLAVARAAKRFHSYVNDYSDPIDEMDGPMRRALARLDKVSGRMP